MFCQAFAQLMAFRNRQQICIRQLSFNQSGELLINLANFNQSNTNFIIEISLSVQMRIDKNMVAVITGGASGLGLATARMLADLGATVVIADLNQQIGQKLAEQLKGSFFKTDVSNQQNIIDLYAFIKKQYGRLNVIINCAGIFGARTQFDKGIGDTQILKKVLSINVGGSINMAKHGAKLMLEQEAVEGERGVVVNVSSITGIQGPANYTIYSASKGAILGMTLPMARDLGKHDIRVMTVAPGYFQTPMTGVFLQNFSQFVTKNTPTGKIGQPHQFALSVKAVIENAYVTGATWRLDGGLRVPYY